MLSFFSLFSGISQLVWLFVRLFSALVILIEDYRITEENRNICLIPGKFTVTVRGQMHCNIIKITNRKNVAKAHKIKLGGTDGPVSSC